MMQILAGNEGAYVLGVLDCCRENYHALFRNSGGAPMSHHSDCEETDQNYVNLIITHACPANGMTAARSSVAVEYFNRLRKYS